MSAGVADFAAFAAALPEEPALVAELRPILERDTFVAAVVAAGAARGHGFAAEDVLAALAANRHGWLLHTVPVL